MKSFAVFILAACVTGAFFLLGIYSFAYKIQEANKVSALKGISNT